MANMNIVWTFENEKEFESFIKNEPHHVFGEEKIHWDIDQNLPGSETLPGAKYRKKLPDWVGKDPKGNIVIVEIKFFKGDSGPDLDAIHKSVGQILDYATASMEVSPRLYIIVHPVASPTLEKICKLLREHGINIQQIAV